MVIVTWCALIALGPESDLVLAYSPAGYTLRTLSPTMFRSIFPSPFFAHLTSQLEKSLCSSRFMPAAIWLSPFLIHS